MKYWSPLDQSRSWPAIISALVQSQRRRVHRWGLRATVGSCHRITLLDRSERDTVSNSTDVRTFHLLLPRNCVKFCRVFLEKSSIEWKEISDTLQQDCNQKLHSNMKYYYRISFMFFKLYTKQFFNKLHVMGENHKFKLRVWFNN